MDKNKNARIPFTCRTCGKTVGVQEDIHAKNYDGQTECLMCRVKNKKPMTDATTVINRALEAEKLLKDVQYSYAMNKTNSGAVFIGDELERRINKFLGEDTDGT
jgi:hypothetical protein